MNKGKSTMVCQLSTVNCGLLIKELSDILFIHLEYNI